MPRQLEEGRASLKDQSDPREGVFDTPTVVTVSAAHFVHDTYAGFLPSLLPVLIERHAIPMAAAGALVSVYRAASMIQPFLGVWADRADSRYFVISAPILTGVAMCVLGLAPSYLAVLLLLALAGLSVATFHPAAAATVTRYSGSTWGKGTSWFQFGGELGRSFGPFFIVTWIAWFGLESSYLAAIPALLFSVLLYLRLYRGGIPKMRGTSVSSIWEAVKAERRSLLLLSGMVLFRSTAVQSFAAFLPTYLTGRGSSLMFAGMALALFELAGAAGALVGGTLSDRYGRRNMLLVSQLIGGPLLFVTLGLPDGPAQLALLSLAGAVTISSSPVQLTLAQEILPGGRSTATGIIFFLGFEGTLVATLLVGVVADWVGLGPALAFSVLASMLSIPFTLAIPEPKKGS